MLGQARHQPTLAPSARLGMAETLHSKDKGSVSAVTSPSSPLHPPSHSQHFPSPATTTAPFSRLPFYSPGATKAFSPPS